MKKFLAILIALVGTIGLSDGEFVLRGSVLISVPGETNTVTNTVTVTNLLLYATGQTNSFLAGDDGTYQKGYVWPNPRFTVGTGDATNCVTDNLTGLMWGRNPSLASLIDWTNAIAYCEAIDGTGGFGGYTDWRLPNVAEALSLICSRYTTPALCDVSGTNQFTTALGPWTCGIGNNVMWTSTHSASYNGKYGVYLNHGVSEYLAQITVQWAWPVRGP